MDAKTRKDAALNTVTLSLIVTHGVGLLLVLIGILAQVPAMRRNDARVTWVAVAGAGLLLLSGITMTILMAIGGDPNWPKLAVKFTLGLAIFVGLLVHRGRVTSSAMLWGMLGATVLNAVIAVVW